MIYALQVFDEFAAGLSPLRQRGPLSPGGGAKTACDLDLHVIFRRQPRVQRARAAIK